MTNITINKVVLSHRNHNYVQHWRRGLSVKFLIII